MPEMRRLGSKLSAFGQRAVCLPAIIAAVAAICVAACAERALHCIAWQVHALHAQPWRISGLGLLPRTGRQPRKLVSRRGLDDFLRGVDGQAPSDSAKVKGSRVPPKVDPPALDEAIAAEVVEQGAEEASVPPPQQQQGAAPPGVTSSPEAVIATLIQVAGPGLGVPPPEIVGQALRSAGIPATPENAARALKAADPSGLSADAVAVFAVIEAANAPPEGQMPAATPGTLQGAQSSAPFAPSPESVAAALTQAAGPGAGAPPPEIIQQALVMMGLPATPENMERTLRAIAQEQQVRQVQQVQQPLQPPLQAQQSAQSDAGFPMPVAGASQEAVDTARAVMASVQTPEDAVRALRQVAAASAGDLPDSEQPPPEVIGQTVCAMGLPPTKENMRRALKEAAGPGAPEPSMEDIVVALEAAASYRSGPTGMPVPPAP